MSTGLYLPIDIISGETIDLPFDIKEDGEYLLLGDKNLVGQIRDLATPALVWPFAFTEDDYDPNIYHARVESTITSSIPQGSYLFEISMTDGADASAIFYGSVTLRPTIISIPSNSASTPSGMFIPVT